MFGEEQHWGCCKNSKLEKILLHVGSGEGPEGGGAKGKGHIVVGAHVGHPPARAAFRVLFNVQQSQIAIKLLECFICLV